MIMKAEHSPSTTSSSDSPPNASSRPPLAILLVNDDEDGLFLLKLDLQRVFPEATLVTAKNGQHALDALSQTQFHAVVTDNRMPQMSGMTLVKKIREKNPTIPIVMATCSDEARDEAFQVGVNYFTSDNRLGKIARDLRSQLEALIR